MERTHHAPADAEMTFSGRLMRNGEARVKQIDGIETVPVLLLDIESDSPMHMPLRVEQMFPTGHMDQCRAAARRYRKGQQVSVQASVLSARLTVTANHIHTEKSGTES